MTEEFPFFARAYKQILSASRNYTPGLEPIFYNARNDLKLPDLIDLLAEKVAQDEVTFEGSPARGRHGIAELGLNQFSRRYIYHRLARLTAFVEVSSGQPGFFDKYVD